LMALSSRGTSVNIRAMPARQFLIVLSLAGLTSCGGGGDGGNSGPHGAFPGTQANLTAANAPTFARLAELAARAGATVRLGEFLTSVTGNTFTDGGCGAGGQATLALNAPSGAVSGTATYTNFDRCFGMRANGTANVTGTLQTGNRVDAMSFTSFTGLAFTTGSETIQASGTAALDWTSVAPDSTYVMILNATTSGAASFQLENFRIEGQSGGAGVENISISGRLTTADGFVDISTVATARPQLFVPSSGLQGGQVIMTGTTTVATVTYNGPAPATFNIVPR
jgi:hypothetical protein